MTKELIQRMANAGVKELTVNFVGEEKARGSITMNIANLKNLEENFEVDAFAMAINAFITEIENREKGDTNNDITTDK